MAFLTDGIPRVVTSWPFAFLSSCLKLFFFPFHTFLFACHCGTEVFNCVPAQGPSLNVQVCTVGRWGSLCKVDSSGSLYVRRGRPLEELLDLRPILLFFSLTMRWVVLFCHIPDFIAIWYPTRNLKTVCLSDWLSIRASKTNPKWWPCFLYELIISRRQKD